MHNYVLRMYERMNGQMNERVLAKQRLHASSYVG